MERSLSLSRPLALPRAPSLVRAGDLAGFALTALVAALVLGPVAFLFWKGLGSDLTGLPARLGELALAATAARVFLLSAVATLLALAWAVPLAWLTARTDLPARRLIHWLAPLPLAVPPYIGALVYQMLLVPGGSRPGLTGFLNIYSPWGAAWVLSLFTYPYIYILVRAALERANPLLEDVARAAGMGRLEVLRRVVLPMLRPSLLAGCLLVFLYGWADFGVVSLLRVRTLTTVIYDYVQGTMDWTLPAALSVVLTAVTLLVLLVQLKCLGRAGYAHTSSGVRPPRAVRLGRARWPALGYVCLVLGFSFFLPIAVLTSQASSLGALGVFKAVASEAGVVANSLSLAASGASLTLLVALAVGWLQERRSRNWGASSLFQVGYAVPGTVLGLGMVGLYHTFLPSVYSSPLVVALAYVCLFSAPALQAVRAAFEQLPPSLEEAARSLGRGPIGAFREVALPLVGPGLLGGWVLVFILSMRELAATLVVRPPGLETLPVRIWTYTVDVGPDPRAAALALALVALVALPWLLLVYLRPRAAQGGP